MARTDITIRIADWKKDKINLVKIHRLVFIEEQNVPEELEWDNADDNSIHFLASLDDKVIATARLTVDGQIGRMAVLTGFRNQGIGSRLLHFVLQTAISRGFKQVYLHAQLTAVHFYKKQGFKPCSEIFYEANIPHQKMQLKI